MPHGAEGAAGMVELGRRLFFEPALSRDSTRACADCHVPDAAFADHRTVSVGVEERRGTRNVPSLVNRGWGQAFFWDGRIASLEAQVLQPILAPVEMDLTLEEAVGRLTAKRAYREGFRRVFRGAVTEERLAAALAAYVRTIRSGGSPFDRFLAGELDALSDEERHGLELFQGKARCSRCHLGPLLTDESFHNTGVAWRSGTPADSGRALVTGDPADVGAFKTPGLREVARTAPYMHDGAFATLEEVVSFYDRGGHPNGNLDSRIRPLHLREQEKRALVAFLRTLSGQVVEGTRSPILPESRVIGPSPNAPDSASVVPSSDRE